MAELSRSGVLQDRSSTKSSSSCSSSLILTITLQFMPCCRMQLHMMIT